MSYTTHPVIARWYLTTTSSMVRSIASSTAGYFFVKRAAPSCDSRTARPSHTVRGETLHRMLGQTRRQGRSGCMAAYISARIAAARAATRAQSRPVPCAHRSRRAAAAAASRCPESGPDQAQPGQRHQRRSYACTGLNTLLTAEQGCLMISCRAYALRAPSIDRCPLRSVRARHRCARLQICTCTAPCIALPVRSI